MVVVTSWESSETLPKAIRHSAWHYHMTSAAERRETGHWWRRELVAVGPPIEPKITGPHHGVRDSFDPLLLNRLALGRRCFALRWL